MSKSSPRKKGISDEPGPSFHEKKAKNAKEYNFGKGEKKRMTKANKHKGSLTRGPKKK